MDIIKNFSWRLVWNWILIGTIPIRFILAPHGELIHVKETPYKYYFTALKVVFYLFIFILFFSRKSKQNVLHLELHFAQYGQSYETENSAGPADIKRFW